MKSFTFLKLSSLFLPLAFCSSVTSSEFDINTIEILNSSTASKVGIYGNYGIDNVPKVIVIDKHISQDEMVFTFPDTLKKAKVFFISDKDGDGVEDIAFFGKNRTNGRYQLFVKSGSQPEQLIAMYNWPIKWQQAQILDADDINGDGIRDVGLYATNTFTGVPQISVLSGAVATESLGVFSFPRGRANKQIELFDDVNTDKVDEYGLFSITRKDKPVLFIRSGNDPSVKLEQYNWPANWTNESIVKLPDITADDVGEIGLFGKLKSDGRWQLHVKSGVTRKGVVNIYSWPASFENVTFHVINDITADGIPEFAVLGYNTANEKWQLQIKSGADRTLVNNVTWNGDFVAPELFAISDANNNGTIDFALVGKRDNNDAIQVQIKDGINGNLINSVNVNDLSRPVFSTITQYDKTTLRVTGILNNKPVARTLLPNGNFEDTHHFTADFINKYKTGIEVYDYSSSGYTTIGEGENAINLDFSGRGGNSVYFYNDHNSGVDISYGAKSISDIYDATKFSYQGRTVEPEVNSTNSVVVAKNSAGFYAAIQIIDVRNNSYDGNIDSVVFEWAIRTDGSADFSSFEGKQGVSLVKCEEPGFFNEGGCKLVTTPYIVQESRSVQQSPRPQSFTLADFTLISHENDLEIFNLVALDQNRHVAPTFNGLTEQEVLPKSHSRSFTLTIPATGYRTAKPLFQLSAEVDGEKQTLLQYSGSFTSN